MIQEIIINLLEHKDRQSNARKLAKEIGANALIIFLKDPENNEYLPAPGFPKSLPFGKKFYEFIKNVAKSGDKEEKIEMDNGSVYQFYGFKINNSSVLITIGGLPNIQKFQEARGYIELLISSLSKEAELLKDKYIIKDLKTEISKADELAKILNKIRFELHETLIQQKNDKKAIEDLLKQKNDFINIASHELKTPLTTLNVYLELLADNLNDSKSDLIAFIKKAQKSSHRLSTLVKNLLDVTHIELNNINLSIEDVELNKLIRDCIEDVTNTNETHTINFYAGKKSFHVSGDILKLEQVVFNFLLNAIKYSSEASQINVYTYQEDDKVKVIVEDFGIGISVEDQKNIFTKFFRVDKKFSGIGLGLYISANIIKSHSGDIGVVSEAGKGSKFWFTLPVK